MRVQVRLPSAHSCHAAGLLQGAQLLDPFALGHWLRRWLHDNNLSPNGLCLGLDDAWLTRQVVSLSAQLSERDVTFQLAAELPWDPGSIAAGASAQINVPLQGARPGDFATAAFSLATSGIVMLAQVGATNIVTVTAWNRSGIAINLAAGTVRARVTKA